MISTEYVPAYFEARGERFTGPGWQRALLGSASRDALLQASTAAAFVAGAPGENGADLRAEWRDHLLSSLTAELASPLRAALEDTRMPRVLLDRPNLLRAVKLVLTEGRDDPSAHLDPMVVITLLSHHVGAERHRAVPGEPLLGGYPESLAMEVVQNAYFHGEDEFGDALARTRLLWTAYEDRLDRYRPRAPLRTMIAEATGLDLDDLLAAGFACHAQVNQSSVKAAYQIDLATAGLSEATVDTFLARFSRSKVELADAVVAGAGRWEFLPFEATPLLRVGRTTASIVDAKLLQLRLTSGLYWLVHDHEKQTYGEQARQAWTQTYSELVELHVEDQLRRLAPRDLSGAPTVFTEEDLIPLGGQRADVGVDLGPAVLLADVVQHQLTIPARQRGNADAFRADMEKSVLKKAGQLSGTADALLRTPLHPDHPLRRRPARLLPAVVQGAMLPITGITVGYARDEVRRRGLLAQPETGPLLLLNLAELEMLEGLVASGHTTVLDALEDWIAADTDDCLRNYLVDRYGGASIERPAAVSAALDEQLAAFDARLRPKT